MIYCDLNYYKIGRHNITDAAKIRLALKKEGVLAKQARERQFQHLNNQNSVVKENFPERDGQVRDLIGQDAGVSGKTVDKFKYIEKHAPEMTNSLCADGWTWHLPMKNWNGKKLRSAC